MEPEYQSQQQEQSQAAAESLHFQAEEDASASLPPPPLQLKASVIQRDDKEGKGNSKSEKKPKPGEIQEIASLLKGLPVKTKEEREATQSGLKTAMEAILPLKDVAVGAVLPKKVGGALIGVGVGVGIFNLMSQLVKEEYTEATSTLIGIVGNIANCIIALEITSGSVATFLGTVANAAPFLAIAAAVIAAAVDIPFSVNRNFYKMFFITDVSGILTSWVYNDSSISPHKKLMRRAKYSGTYGTDISEAIQAAHRAADTYWQEHFAGKPEEIEKAKQDQKGQEVPYHQFWMGLAQELEARLAPSPAGIATSMAKDYIQGIEKKRKEKARKKRAPY